MIDVLNYIGLYFICMIVGKGLFLFLDNIFGTKK